MTKLNTILKTSVLALAVLVIAFMFSACGKSSQFSEVKVDTKANYANSTLTEVNEAFAESTPSEPGEESVSGFHMSINMAISNVTPAGTVNSTAKYNMYFKNTTNANGNKMEVAMKISGTANGQKQGATLYYIVNDPNEGEGTEEFYANIDNMEDYTTPGATISGKYKFTSESDLGEMLLMTCEMMYSMVEALSPFGENEFFVETNQFAMATKGDTTKIRIVIPGATEAENATAYYILKNGQFDSFKVENLVDSDEYGSETINMAVKSWAGDIDYPSFKKYKEYQPVVA